jgi:hypothetical protein
VLEEYGFPLSRPSSHGGSCWFEFFTAAAEAMRRVLVNHAWDGARLKRGGGRSRVDLDRLTSPDAASDLDLLDLDEALDRLASEVPLPRNW